MAARRGECGDCFWWDPDYERIKFVPLLSGQTKLGFCRKHKPIIYQIGGFFHGDWGAVDTGEGCAEYRKVEE